MISTKSCMREHHHHAQAWLSHKVSHLQALPEPQWLKVDVRSFDMNVLGKFGVIMADPPVSLFSLLIPYLAICSWTLSYIVVCLIPDPILTHWRDLWSRKKGWDPSIAKDQFYFSKSDRTSYVVTITDNLQQTSPSKSEHMICSPYCVLHAVGDPSRLAVWNNGGWWNEKDEYRRSSRWWCHLLMGHRWAYWLHHGKRSVYDVKSWGRKHTSQVAKIKLPEILLVDCRYHVVSFQCCQDVEVYCFKSKVWAPHVDICYILSLRAPILSPK